MMIGSINEEREAVLRLQIQGPEDQSVEVEAVIDTGYNGTLSLPPEIIAALALLSRGARQVTLGDGSSVYLNIYRATVIWDGQPLAAQVMETEDVTVLGMSLLYGYRLVMDVVDGGGVTIEAHL